MMDTNRDNFNRTIKVIVLDGADTWARDAYVFSVTNAGYQKLVDGTKFSELDDKDVVDCKSVLE